MIRTTSGVKKKHKHKKVLKLAKGYYGLRSTTYKKAKETIQRALCFSYRDRKVNKRRFRKLWIIKINAAVRNFGLSYSKFINLLKINKIIINRKNLSDLILNDINSLKSIIDNLKK